MEKSSITNTTISDLPVIYDLYDKAIAYQKSRNFPVWNGYDKRVINDEIENKSQYKILINNELAAIFSACQPGHVEAELWQERAEKKAIYLHRIIVNRDFKGQKIFAKILQWTEEFIAGKGYQYIRMDTWADNPTLIDYYKSFGFEEAGIGYTSDSEDLPSQYRKVKIIMLEKTATHLSAFAKPHIHVAGS